MYIVTGQASRARRVIEALHRELELPCEEVHAWPVGTSTLLWTKSDVGQNLHVFPDAFVIGQLRPGEPSAERPVHHVEARPAALHPLVRSVVLDRSSCVLEPNAIASAYHAGAAASDRQLLLGAVLGCWPSPEGVATLAGVGYLPGNSTLFAEVQRVPLGHALHLTTGQVQPTRTWELVAASDEDLVDHLVGLVPTDVPHWVALSGGIDSRFCLGVLRRAGADVRPLRLSCGPELERETAEALARQLGLDLHDAGRFEDEPVRSPRQQVLAVDAQIYAGVPPWARLARSVGAGACIHSGHFGETLIKNTAKSAWKVPRSRRAMWPALVDSFLIPGLPTAQPALLSMADRAELREHLLGLMAFGTEYLELRTRRQMANWFDYLNSLRWCQALFADLSIDGNPTYLLGDPDAHMMGLGSSAWSNMHHERARRLVQVVLPEVHLPFASGLAARPSAGPSGWVAKLYYEYPKRATLRTRMRRKAARRPPQYVDHLPATPGRWDRYFSAEPAHCVSVGDTTFRRAALSVAHVLWFLELCGHDLASAGPMLPGLT